MGGSTKIEWADFTFNPWRGCTKVSPACEHCYAETMSLRNPKTLGVWGKHGTRVIASEAMWREPLKWNKKAGEGICPDCRGKKFVKDKPLLKGVDVWQNCGRCNMTGFVEPYRPRVFCASLADVFEGQETLPDGTRNAIREARKRLFALIHATPKLDWLLLTKRPELVKTILESDVGLHGPLRADFPNVWIGTTVEDQKYADIRVPHLLEIDAAVLWLSIEPLLGPVDLTNVSTNRRRGAEQVNALTGDLSDRFGEFVDNTNKIDWAIVGGESGPNARPMHPDWVRSIRDQCVNAGVPFFFKQWGEWGDAGHLTEVNDRGSGRAGSLNAAKKGKKAEVIAHVNSWGLIES